MEIERKWILPSLPQETSDCKIVGHYSVEQFYVTTEPEVRLRRQVTLCGAKKPRYKLTIKSADNGGLSREEIETEVPEAFYEAVKLFVKKCPIIKDFYIFKYNDYIIEVSSVDGGKFYYAEIEFETEDEAKEFDDFPFDGAFDLYEHPEYLEPYKMKNYWDSECHCCGDGIPFPELPPEEGGSSEGEENSPLEDDSSEEESDTSSTEETPSNSEES